MKKLILTSPQFSGEVELIYGIDSMLVLMDMQNAELSEKQIKFMKELAPVVYDKASFKGAFKSDSLTVLEADFEVTFDMWYEDYGYKRNRERCIKLFDKMSKAEHLKAFAGIRKYKRHLALNTWKTQMDPENYLRKKEWLNEYK